ncbi:MAG TPA: DNA-3-methyladenine glycosylase 2 family protein [Chitinophagaceae bacterium]|nr:DNA-3-methyladenine glycosylase 2 family protein [Chitinophagaceae bacterium]
MHYISHLSKDVVLKKLIDEQEKFELEIQKNLCIYLCLSIMSQQLSTKVAEVFKKRFLTLYKGKPTPQKILDTAFDTLRAIGLSNAKANYIQNVARFELEQGMSFSKLSKMSDEEVISYLTQIKGVGRWTVEMLLMFALGREDLFAMDDLGLQQAVIGLYGLKHRKKKTMQAAIKKISEQWAPYRTYACLHLWHWKDNTP